MARTPFTLRIDAEERVALESLSKIEGRPINQLLNEAIKSYLSPAGSKRTSLEANSRDFEHIGRGSWISARYRRVRGGRS